MSLELKTPTFSDVPSSAYTSAAPDLTLIPIPELRLLIGEVALEIFRSINADTQMRLDGCFENPALLNQGLFSANEYYTKIQEVSQQLEKLDPESSAAETLKVRIEYFIERGSFYHGFCNTEFFTHIKTKESATGKQINIFRIRLGKSPSEAIENITGTTRQFMLTDCVGRYQLIYTATLMHILGKEKFNTLFASEGDYPLSIGMQSTYMGLLLQANRSTLQPGDLVTFKHYPIYMDKHWNGEGRGLNWLFYDKQDEEERFIAFGHPAQGVSYQTVLKTCIDEYNETPIHISAMSKRHGTKLLQLHGPKAVFYYEGLKQHQISVKELEEYYKKLGTSFDSIGCFNAGRIHRLICTSPAGALALMKKWDGAPS